MWGGATVIETGKSSDGNQWYRLWSDGWLEQGGTQIGNGAYSEVTVTFLKPFKDTSYFVNAAITNLTSQWFIGSTGVQERAVTDVAGSIGTKTVASFTLQSFNNHNWYACGQS